MSERTVEELRKILANLGIEASTSAVKQLTKRASQDEKLRAETKNLGVSLNKQTPVQCMLQYVVDEETGQERIVQLVDNMGTLLRFAPNTVLKEHEKASGEELYRLFEAGTIGCSFKELEKPHASSVAIVDEAKQCCYPLTTEKGKALCGPVIVVLARSPGSVAQKADLVLQSRRALVDLLNGATEGDDEESEPAATSTTTGAEKKQKKKSAKKQKESSSESESSDDASSAVTGTEETSATSDPTETSSSSSSSSDENKKRKKSSKKDKKEGKHRKDRQHHHQRHHQTKSEKKSKKDKKSEKKSKSPKKITTEMPKPKKATPPPPPAPKKVPVSAPVKKPTVPVAQAKQTPLPSVAVPPAKVANPVPLPVSSEARHTAVSEALQSQRRTEELFQWFQSLPNPEVQ